MAYVALWLYTTLLGLPLLACQDNCSRAECRIVRKTLEEVVEPVFQQHSVSIPASCPLSRQRDMFGIHEQHKFEESASKWVCRFCGKSFYEERFLDLHFENRHGDRKLMSKDAVCLADYCGMFRCTVLKGHDSAGYWDVALCKDEDLVDFRRQCETVMQDCLPKEIKISQRQKLFEALNETVCSFLTCAKFWEPREEKVEPASAALYIMLLMMLLVCLCIYYFLAFSHFYDGDQHIAGQVDDGHQGHISKYSAAGYGDEQEIRNRHHVR